MKALIRDKKEIVKETDDVFGIDWKNGEPLTRPEWVGGPYTLVENYVGPEDPEEVPVYGIVTPEGTPAADPQEDVVRLNGNTYTKDEIEELRRSLNL